MPQQMPRCDWIGDKAEDLLAGQVYFSVCTDLDICSKTWKAVLSNLLCFHLLTRRSTSSVGLAELAIMSRHVHLGMLPVAQTSAA